LEPKKDAATAPHDVMRSPWGHSKPRSDGGSVHHYIDGGIDCNRERGEKRGDKKQPPIPLIISQENCDYRFDLGLGEVLISAEKVLRKNGQIQINYYKSAMSLPPIHSSQRSQNFTDQYLGHMLQRSFNLYND
jgi:hypothetical protein